ncbi:hypothetical protein VT50_0213745 [Streptomyces antioxidans]|uniref:Uncharacterized protein n=1 Tax=Streptomyces antioxidans TaxID=1507734 RepID=A0A1V4D6I5_9ACTN|nr:hypothetical protein VT50_0213745 [Streptomyces antioxidans]
MGRLPGLVCHGDIYPVPHLGKGYSSRNGQNGGRERPGPGRRAKRAPGALVPLSGAVPAVTRARGRVPARPRARSAPTAGKRPSEL